MKAKSSFKRSFSSIFIAMLILFCNVANVLQAQNLTESILGAWEITQSTIDGKTLKGVVIFTPGYQSFALYDSQTGAFVSTNGGKWILEGNQITETVEFDSKDSTRVGKKVTFSIAIDNNTLTISGSNDQWKRIDEGKPGLLSGAWLFSGRKQNETIEYRSTDGPRKTMKIMSGSRFQWIAYHTETGVFSGTGGGNYQTVNGKYTENIEFFSRDINRVGASLEFEFKLIEGIWHHSGKNSRGEPLYEVWTMRRD